MSGFSILRNCLPSNRDAIPGYYFMGEIVVLVTVGSEDEATKISRILVESELAACVNIIPGVRSIFHWDGKINEEQEYLLLVKTVDRVFDQLALSIKSNHSYSVPEILALPIRYGNADYLAWIRRVTKKTHSQEEGK